MIEAKTRRTCIPGDAWRTIVRRTIDGEEVVDHYLSPLTMTAEEAERDALARPRCHPTKAEIARVKHLDLGRLGDSPKHRDQLSLACGACGYAWVAVAETHWYANGLGAQFFDAERAWHIAAARESVAMAALQPCPHG